MVRVFHCEDEFRAAMKADVLASLPSTLSADQARAAGLPWVSDSPEDHFMRRWHATMGPRVERLMADGDKRGLALMHRLFSASWNLAVYEDRKHAAWLASVKRVQGGSPGERAKPRNAGR